MSTIDPAALAAAIAAWHAAAPLDPGTPPAPLEGASNPAAAAVAAITATWTATHEAMLAARIAHADHFVAATHATITRLVESDAANAAAIEAVL